MEPVESYTLEAVVSAHGQQCAGLDGAHFVFTRDGTQETWKVTSDLLDQEVSLQEGDRTQVVVNGVSRSDHLIPRPWGLLTRLTSDWAFTAFAWPEQVSRHPLDDGRVRTTVKTGAITTTLVAHESGFVIEQTISVDGEVREHIELREIRYARAE